MSFLTVCPLSSLVFLLTFLIPAHRRDRSLEYGVSFLVGTMSLPETMPGHCRTEKAPSY